MTSPGNFFGEIGHCSKYMKNLRKSIIFQGLEGVWAPKSEALWAAWGTSRWHGRPKVDSDRAAGGVRRVILTSPGQLFGEIGHCLKYMKNIRKSMVFQGLEGVWAPKSELLGPKSRALDGTGRSQVGPWSIKRRRGRQKLRLSGRVGCRSYGNQMEIRRKSPQIKKNRPKSYVSGRTYD